MTKIEKHLKKLKEKESNIIIEVCRKLDVKLEDFFSNRRFRQRSILPRFIASYLFRKLDYSLTEIAKIVSIKPKDHTTIIHSVKTMNNLIDTDENIKKLVFSLDYLTQNYHEIKNPFTSLKYRK